MRSLLLYVYSTIESKCITCMNSYVMGFGHDTIV